MTTGDIVVLSTCITYVAIVLMNAIYEHRKLQKYFADDPTKSLQMIVKIGGRRAPLSEDDLTRIRALFDNEHQV